MDVAQVRQKARQGLKANAFRHVSVQAMGAVTTIVLARHLTPHQFGAFGALSLATQFFTVWGGLGIGVVLIRQLEEPTEGEMNAAFGFQILLSSLLCLALGFSAPLIEIFVRPAAAAINISAATWVLAACAWLTSLRLIPNVRLQRGIDFVNLAWVEFAENLAYNVTAIILAFSGTGVWALLVATLARAITGCALLSVFSPWRPTRQIDLSRLRRVVALGFSFESIPIISFAKDLALPAFIGTTLGLTHLGYFVWARDLGTKFVTFGRLYGKVAFPTFSRLDEDESACTRFPRTLLPTPGALLLAGRYIVHRHLTSAHRHRLWREMASRPSLSHPFRFRAASTDLVGTCLGAHSSAEFRRVAVADHRCDDRI